MSPLPANFETSPFDTIRHEDEQGEYWFARELAKVLGYDSRDSWKNFEKAINRAIKACESSDNTVSDHVADVSNMVSIGSGAQREVHDYRLTRYACYLIAQNADPAKEVVARAQTYFAVRTREAELNEMASIEAQVMGLAAQLAGDPLAEVAQRIALREELSDANRELLKRAYEAGVISHRQLAMFMNMGYKGLYDGRTEDDLHALRGLTPSQKISDYMGALETFANYLRALLGKHNIQTRQVATVRQAGVAHYDAGQTVRDIFLQSMGIGPEDLPRPTKSYKQIVKEAYARIQREEEEEQGLWGHLPTPGANGEA